MTTLSDKARELIEARDAARGCSFGSRKYLLYEMKAMECGADVAKGYLELEAEVVHLQRQLADERSGDSDLMKKIKRIKSNYKIIEEQNKKLRETLESIAAIQIGPDEVVKSFFQGHDVESLVQVATNDTLIARQSLAEVKE